MSDYRSVRAVNNSLMGVYEDDYSAFVAHWVGKQPLPRKDEEYLTLGTMVDTLLTKPDDYDELFTTFEGKTPTAPLMLKFCNELKKLYSIGMPLDGYYPLAYRAAGINTPKLEGFVERFGEYRPYFDFLVSSERKTVISKEQDGQARLIVEQLKTNPYTRDIVNAQNTETGVVFNQMELYGDYRGIRTKGALDRVLISHRSETVQPIDFKTSYNVLDFKNSYYKYRYYRQGSYYTFLLREWLDANGFEDYRILPFMFVVCSTSGGQHWRYRMTERDLEMAECGGETTWGYPIKGWRTILDEMWHMTNVSKEWAFPYECQVNDGVMQLNIFK